MPCQPHGQQTEPHNAILYSGNTCGVVWRRGKSIGGRTNHCRGHGRDELLQYLYTGNKDYTSQMIVRITSTCGIAFLDIIATPSPRKVRSKVSHVDVLTQTPCGVPKTSASCVHVKANPPNSHTCKAQPFIIQLTSSTSLHHSTPDRSKLQGTLNSANSRHIFRSQFDLTTFPHLRRHCFS